MVQQINLDMEQTPVLLPIAKRTQVNAYGVWWLNANEGRILKRFIDSQPLGTPIPKLVDGRVSVFACVDIMIQNNHPFYIQTYTANPVTDLSSGSDIPYSDRLDRLNERDGNI
jgi:hypothetical protein